MFARLSHWLENDCKYEIKYPWSGNASKKMQLSLKGQRATKESQGRIGKQWLNYKKHQKLWNIKIKL